MAKKKAPPKVDPEAIRQKDIKEHLDNFCGYPPEHRKNKIGDRVQYGAHPNAEVITVFDEGRVLEVKLWGEYSHYGIMKYEERTQIVNWIDIVPLQDAQPESFKQNQDIRLDYAQMTIGSAIHTYFYFGIDMNPDYQRDYVWGYSDKVSLIDSIFNNRNIGSYILVHLGYSGKYTYEVLDGKQRINALVEFYEDRFKYKGKYFSELSYMDQSHFEKFMFPRAEIRESRDQQVSKEKKIKIFLHVNTTGRVMSEEHLAKVKAMLKEEVYE